MTAIDTELYTRSLHLGRLIDAAQHSLALAQDAYQRHDDAAMSAALHELTGAATAASRLVTMEGEGAMR